MPDPPDSLLRLMTSVDDCRRLALLAESNIGDGAEVVALSEVAALDDHTAEVAFVVHDEWQRLDLGTTLASERCALRKLAGSISPSRRCCSTTWE